MNDDFDPQALIACTDRVEAAAKECRQSDAPLELARVAFLMSLKPLFDDFDEFGVFLWRQGKAITKHRNAAAGADH